MSGARRPRCKWVALMAAGLALSGASASAEPYFAVMTGQKCVACHVNVTGGGMRTPYGNAFAQKQLPARVEDFFWDGTVMEYLSVGGNLRASATATSVSNEDDEFSFDTDNVLAYFATRLLDDRLTLYVDQQFAPGSSNREAYALMQFRERTLYVKAGSLFLPFGWRLQDDTEFVREVSGINYNTPDNGVEGGVELGPASLRLAVTNGTAGGAETNRGKQWSLLGSYVRSRWRIGGSLNYNDAGSEDRTMLGAFAGLRTGPVSWLAEIDYIDDNALGPDGRQQWVGFAEANWWIRRGHNLKFTYGYFDPDDDVDEDERNRYSVVYEYFPLPFLQLRGGLRSSDGIPQNDQQNADQAFLQLHVYY